jgi:hypothetical protein
MQLSTYIQYFIIFQQTLKISFLMKIHQVHFIQGKKICATVIALCSHVYELAAIVI